MFTQKISMKCTKEQYEKYLKDDLLKMGYIDSSLFYWDLPDYSYIVNNFNFENGQISNINVTYITDKDRTYLGEFNANLFLALAAMTDVEDGCYGEWWYILIKNCEYFTHGNLYKGLDSILNYGSFIDNMGERNGFSLHGPSKIFNNLRKATVEEIFDKFKPEKELKMKDGEYYYCRLKNARDDGGWVYIYKPGNYKTTNYTSLSIVSSYVYTAGIVAFNDDIEILRLASSEERKLLNQELSKKGKYFNPITSTIEETQEEVIPEKGKYYYCKCNNEEWVFISNGVNKNKTDRIASVELQHLLDPRYGFINPVTEDLNIEILRLATQEERAILNKALLDKGQYFNPITNTIDSAIITSRSKEFSTIKYSIPEESAIELLKSKGYIITKQF